MKRELPLNDNAYWATVRAYAKKYKFDGCSGVPDFYRLACDEHDYHYRFGRTIFGDAITQDEADVRMRVVIRHLAKTGLSWHPRSWKHVVGFPMSWWRWAALSVVGDRAWEEHRAREREIASE